ATTVQALAIRPGDAGDEAVGLQRAQDAAGLRIDLVDLALAALAHPQTLLPAGHHHVESAPEHARAVEGHLLRVVAVHAWVGHYLLHHLVALAPRLVDHPGKPHFLVLLQ